MKKIIFNNTHNDNMADPNGNEIPLTQNSANEILNPQNGIYYSTAIE